MNLKVQNTLFCKTRVILKQSVKKQIAKMFSPEVLKDYMDFQKRVEKPLYTKNPIKNFFIKLFKPKGDKRIILDTQGNTVVFRTEYFPMPNEKIVTPTMYITDSKKIDEVVNAAQKQIEPDLTKKLLECLKKYMPKYKKS